MKLKKSEVIIVGGGGHALTLWDILASHNLFVPLGYTDENKSSLQKLNAKYLGFDSEVGHLASIGVQFVLVSVKLKHPICELMLQKLQQPRFFITNRGLTPCIC